MSWLFRFSEIASSSKDLTKLLLLRLPSWKSFLKAKERSPGWEKDFLIGLFSSSSLTKGWNTDRNLLLKEKPPKLLAVSCCWDDESKSEFFAQLAWLNFSMHSSMSAGGAFLWATVTRPQNSTSNFLAKGSSTSERLFWNSSWRAIFPACRIELIISGTYRRGKKCTLASTALWKTNCKIKRLPVVIFPEGYFNVVSKTKDQLKWSCDSRDTL